MVDKLASFIVDITGQFFVQAAVAGGAVASSAADAEVCGFFCVYELLNSSLQTFF